MECVYVIVVKAKNDSNNELNEFILTGGKIIEQQNKPRTGRKQFVVLRWIFIWFELVGALNVVCYGFFLLLY